MDVWSTIFLEGWCYLVKGLNLDEGWCMLKEGLEGQSCRRVLKEGFEGLGGF